MDKPTIVTAAVLLIGDEILSGRTKDRNLGYISEYLARIAVEVREARVVPDVEDEIVAAVNALRARYDYVVTTGGILGTIRDLDDETVGLEVAPTVVVRVARGAIAKRLGPADHEPPAWGASTDNGDTT